MSTITSIVLQKRRPNRRSIHLDGQFAFGCHVNVVARFRLREGLVLSDEQVDQIRLGEVKQEAFDHAIRLLQSRLRSTAEIRRKLTGEQYGAEVVDAVIADLSRMGYLDDGRFAVAKAQSAAEHRKHGKRRAKLELLKAGVSGEVADQALNQVYDAADSLAAARELAAKKAPALKRLDPPVAKRRLIGMLQRRGFEYDEIKPVVDEFLGGESAD